MAHTKAAAPRVGMAPPTSWTGTESPAATMLRLGSAASTSPRRRTPAATPTRQANPRPAPTPREDSSRLAASVVSCAAVEDVTPQSLGVSYWFDSADVAETGDLPVRLVGRRVHRLPETEDPPGATDSFDLVHVVHAVPSGVGRLCATMRVTGTAPGVWEVDAYPPTSSPVRVRARTGYQPFIGEVAPGASLGAWAGLVGVGALAGLALLALLSSRAQLPAIPIMLVAVIASLVGVVGAKVYYLVQAPGRGSWTSPGGMCIQGFVITALAAVAAGSWLLGLPLLVLMDLATPPLLLGMAIGRLGCWRGGCCAGRLTSGRVAVWGSDRRLGGRRIPTQFIEAAIAAALTVATLLLLGLDPRPEGAVLVAGLGAYVLARQLVFPFRSLSRRTSVGSLVATLVSGLALGGAVIVMIVSAL